MLEVELAILSGHPNPRWALTTAEEANLMEAILAAPGTIRDITDDSFGFPTYIIRLLSKDSRWAERVNAKQLPELCKITSDAPAEILNLLALSSDKQGSEVNDHLRSLLLQSIDQEKKSIQDRLPVLAIVGGPGMTCSNTFLSGNDFSSWNDYSYISANNCYNYASNKRTNTRAQPGRWAGKTLSTPYTATDVADGLFRDGWKTTCQPSASNLTVALVIMPSNPSVKTGDFHFYRFITATPSRTWGHKPGMSMARYTDYKGNVISNPETCDRTLVPGASYSEFCGYFYRDNSGFTVS